MIEEFPKYQMVINGARRFLPFGEAYVAYDSGSADVKFGQDVLEQDFSVREMTEEDRQKISAAADRYSESK
jgi:hypothetical protein